MLLVVKMQTERDGQPQDMRRVDSGKPPYDFGRVLPLLPRSSVDRRR